MSDDSKIEWTDATWNPVRGCSRVSEGCRNCYAERQAARFTKPGEPFHGFAKIVAPRDALDRVGGRRNGWTGRVELIPDMLDVPLRWRRPRRIFVNSMSDLFHEALSDEAIDRVFAVMALAPQHTFQVLTKRPERMWRWSYDIGGTTQRDWIWSKAARIAEDLLIKRPPMPSWPLPNVWLGVSVEDQETADVRIPDLLSTPAAVRFVSYEPALGPVDFARVPVLGSQTNVSGNGLDWIIVGGESGPGARPCDVAWIRSVVAQCKAAGVACFVKQLGARPIITSNLAQAIDFPCAHVIENRVLTLRPADRKGGDPSEWPDDLRVREFPRKEPRHA